MISTKVIIINKYDIAFISSNNNIIDNTNDTTVPRYTNALSVEYMACK